MKTTLWMLAGAALIIVFCDFFRYEEWFIQLGNFLGTGFGLLALVIMLPAGLMYLAMMLLTPFFLLWTLWMLLVAIFEGPKR